MKIVSWNMNYWQQSAMNESAWDFLIRNVKPDIAFLQETVLPEPYKDINCLFQKAYGTQDWGNCIYVRNNISLIDKTSDFFPNVIDIYKGKQIVGEITIDNQKILLVNVHINTRNSQNNMDTAIQNHIDYILKYIEETNLSQKKSILAGDFNGDDSIDYFKLRHEKLEELNFSECNPQFSQTFFGWNTNRHLQDDHIFVTKDLKENLSVTTNGYTSQTWNYGKVKHFSDHTILEIDLKLN